MCLGFPKLHANKGPPVSPPEGIVMHLKLLAVKKKKKKLQKKVTVQLSVELLQQLS